MEARKRDILNADKVRDIKYKLRLGYPTKSIAAQYGVSVQQISQIKWGKRWAHVD